MENFEIFKRMCSLSRQKNGNCLLNSYKQNKTLNESKSNWSSIVNLKRYLSFPTAFSESIASSSGTSAVIDKASQFNSHVDHSKIVSDQDIQEYINNETGLDRLKAAWSKNEKGERSQDVAVSYIVACNTGLIGLVGTMILSKEYHAQEFIKANRAVTFTSSYSANRKRLDYVIKKCMESGLKAGGLMFVLSGIFMSMSHSIAIYRNKTSPTDYAISAGVCGGLYRIKQGLKGFISGSVVGVLFGSVAGVCIWGILSLSGYTQQVRHQWEVQEILMDKINRQARIQGSDPDSSY